MSFRPAPVTDAIADSAVEVELSEPKLIAGGFRPLERYAVTLRHEDGTALSWQRDLLRVGRIVGVLPVDPARGEAVLIQQFRLAAHLSTGLGQLVEIVAGHVEGDEEPRAAAIRECREEIGVAPVALHELFTFMPAPGINDEYATMYLAIVDAERVPDRAGSDHESEHTRPIRVSFDNAIAALNASRIHNGYLILALQWLALNRHRLADFTP